MLKHKILLIITAIAVAILTAVGLIASPASATTNNRLTFAAGGACPTSGPTCYIYTSQTNPYSGPDYPTIRQGESTYPRVSNVECFIPAQNLYSYWNGLYAKNVIRCFASSGNALTLYAYQH